MNRLLLSLAIACGALVLSVGPTLAADRDRGRGHSNIRGDRNDRDRWDRARGDRDDRHLWDGRRGDSGGHRAVFRTLPWYTVYRPVIRPQYVYRPAPVIVQRPVWSLPGLCVFIRW